LGALFAHLGLICCTQLLIYDKRVDLCIVIFQKSCFLYSFCLIWKGLLYKNRLFWQNDSFNFKYGSRSWAANRIFAFAAQLNAMT